MKRVTLDTNVVDAEGLKEAAQEHGFELARVTVTDREVEGTPYQVRIIGLGKVEETAVWGESRWDHAVWASGEPFLERILQIIGDGSFPHRRENLSAGERRQLRS